MEQALVEEAWPRALETVDSTDWNSETHVNGATMWRRPPSQGRERCARPVKVEGLVRCIDAHLLLALLSDPVFKLENDDGTVSVTPVSTTTVKLPVMSANGPCSLEQQRVVPATVMHEATKYPFPLAPRDKVYLLAAGRLPDGRLMAIEVSIGHPDAPPPQRGTIRVDVFAGYTLRQQGSDVVWQIFAEADPGGYIPGWVVDRRVASIASWVSQMDLMAATGDPLGPEADRWARHLGCDSLKIAPLTKVLDHLRIDTPMDALADKNYDLMSSSSVADGDCDSPMGMLRAEIRHLAEELRAAQERMADFERALDHSAHDNSAWKARQMLSPTWACGAATFFAGGFVAGLSCRRRGLL